MKTFAILLCTLYFALYTVVRADEGNESNSCLKKLDIDVADLPKLLTDRSEEGHRQRSCLGACYMQKMGWMTDNTINMEKITTAIENSVENAEKKQELIELVRKCEEESTDDDACKVAHNFLQCSAKELRAAITKMFQSIIPYFL